MNTVKVYQLNHVSKTLFHRLRDAQMEAAQVWNCCMEAHKAARITHEKWPGRTSLQQATKGRFALHSQSIQMVVHAFLTNVETTRQLRQTHPQMKMKYPLAYETFLPRHVACTGCFERTRARGLANGPRTCFHCLASSIAGKQR